MNSQARFLVCLLILTAAVRGMLALATYTIGTDSAQFLRQGELIQNGFFEEAFRKQYHPLFPLLIALGTTLGLSPHHVGIGVSLFAGILTVLPLVLLAEALFGRSVAWLSGLLYAFQPDLVELQTDVMSESLFILLGLTSIFFLYRVFEGARWIDWLISGMAAVGAYFTRPEGILFILSIPLWGITLFLGRYRRRMDPAVLVFSLLTLLLCAVLVFPYLLWIRRELGRWGLSPKSSVERTISLEAEEELLWSVPERIHKVALKILVGRFWMAVPLALLGTWVSQHRWSRGRIAFLWSFPILYASGILWSLPRQPYVSYRYFLPAVTLLLPFTAMGFFWALRRMGRRWAPGGSLFIQGGLLVFFLAQGVRLMGTRRFDEIGLREAGARIREEKRGSPKIMSTTDKIQYYAGGTFVGFPETLEECEREGADYFIFFERDLSGRRRTYLKFLERRSPYVWVGEFPKNDRRKGIEKVYVYRRP